MINLIKFTENDKRLIIVLLLVVILLFVIIGYISLFVRKIMRFQAKRADDMLHDVVVTKTITSESKLRNYGIRKNWRVFFKQASVPFIILAAAWLLFLTYGIIFKDNHFSQIDLWDYKKEGIGTLFYVFDWDPSQKINFWGLKVYPGFPDPINRPHFEWSAWFSYIFVPANIVGIIWLLVDVQAYIARAFRIYKLSMTLFKKTLDKPASLDEEVKPQLTDKQ